MEEVFGKIGDWQRFARLAEATKVGPAVADTIMTTIIQKVGILGQQYAKLHIVAQDLPWQPLNEKYKKAKARKGQSEKIYEKTGYFFDSITTKLMKRKCFVGIPKGLKHPETGKAMHEIAELMENGGFVTTTAGKTYYVPSRALFKPTMYDVMAEVIEKYQPNAIYLKHLKEFVK
jgi:hypothetical protein